MVARLGTNDNHSGVCWVLIIVTVRQHEADGTSVGWALCFDIVTRTGIGPGGPDPNQTEPGLPRIAGRDR